ncbi:MAG: lysine--tRNA ligase [Verrucomicrobia bacterium]|nr:lysine--tRNA ligase [Verrucomicrobiota bacterium]
MSEDLSPLIAARRQKLAQLRELGVDPFGGAFPGTESTMEIRASWAEGRKVRLAGRIVSHRDMGKSQFLHLQDRAGRLQIYVQKPALPEKDRAVFDLLDLGDILGVEGTLFTTKTGEPSVRVGNLTLLTKSLAPLPDKWHGLVDTETRHRHRHLDLISNENSRRALDLRIRLVRYMREFLQAQGFTEVETPMMQTVAGGAAAEPFKTRHHAMGMDLFLRIAPELYLKRLLVGGMEKVFEINRNFRNEGISRKHNPEFTMLEAYWAYSDYSGMANLVEEMIRGAAQELTGGLKITQSDGSELDFSPPWPRKKYRDAVTEAAGADWFQLSRDGMEKRAAELGLEMEPGLTGLEITQKVYEKKVEGQAINPVFITHLPAQLVPLARLNREDPTVVDVYELIIGRQEISPGYSELNDPLLQAERFRDQVGEHTQKVDTEFLEALEHGMPPAGGLGLGVDRLAMLLSGVDSIREVIFFPLLRPRETSA